MLFTVLSLSTYGQELQLVKQVKINQPVAVSTDRYANIYVADNKGNLHKYDSTGNHMSDYTPARLASISSIEAWPTIQVFVFHRDLQQYTFLNRFLTELNTSANQLKSEQIGFVRAATPAADESIWLFDDRDFTLKKYNPRFSSLTVQVPLELVLSSAQYAITYMREYQNMLFISDANSGILVFDNFGNYKKKLPFAGISQFGFHNNQLYFLNKNSLTFFDIYTLSTKSVSLPEGNFGFVLASATQIALFSADSLYIYRIR
jgi:hypothetical protein